MARRKSATYERHFERARGSIVPLFRAVGNFGVYKGRFAGPGEIHPQVSGVMPVVVHGLYQLNEGIIPGPGMQYLHLRGELREPSKRAPHDLIVSARVHDFATVLREQKKDQYGYDSWSNIAGTKSPMLAGPEYRADEILKYAINTGNFKVKVKRHAPSA